MLRQQSFHAAQTRVSQPTQGSGLGRTVSAPSRPSHPAGKEDAKLREVILAEVLDTRPSVQWEDVAGLRTAKQVRPAVHKHLDSLSGCLLAAAASLSGNSGSSAIRRCRRQSQRPIQCVFMVMQYLAPIDFCWKVLSVLLTVWVAVGARADGDGVLVCTWGGQTELDLPSA